MNEGWLRVKKTKKIGLVQQYNGKSYKMEQKSRIFVIDQTIAIKIYEKA